MTAFPTVPAVRRLGAVAAATTVLVGAGALTAGPASAAVPEGWPDTKPVDMLEALAVLVGIPLVLFVLIVAAVYLPGIVRGERVAPGATGPEDQWLGGRRSTDSLEATRSAGALGASTTSGSSSVLDGSEAEAEHADGGASARW
ncbi:hypothetical protein [Nocardioides litoris]|uniref:hypothetical protein n=1 Tax=Nocardioides litoris TaxID=1926648 RepID=UPI00147779A6|nr:hypothetical protein [Nocardioides litoris]